MTIYTDVFTGSSIAGALPYAEIDVDATANVQLLWPTQNINTINSNNSTTYENSYVGNITDIINSGSTTTLNIYLPDATAQVKGTNFTLVNKTSSTVITIYDYTGTLITTLNNSTSTSYTFYVSDNTTQGWEYVYAGTVSSTSTTISVAYNTINNSTANHGVTFYWNGSTAPGTTDDRIQADVVEVINLGTSSSPGFITLPSITGVSNAPGYSFKLINSLPVGNTLKVVENSADGSNVILNIITSQVAPDYIFTIAATTTSGSYYWQVEYANKANSMTSNTVSYFNVNNYILSSNSFAFSSSNHDLYTKWAYQIITNSSDQAHAAYIMVITGATGNPNNIFLPDPTTLSSVGFTINIILKSATSNIIYQFTDIKSNAVIGEYTMTATSYAGYNTRLITCAPIFNTEQTNYTGNYWAINVSIY